MAKGARLGRRPLQKQEEPKSTVRSDCATWEKQIPRPPRRARDDKLERGELGLLVLMAAVGLGCKSGGTTAAPAATAEKPFMSAVAGNPPAVAEDVPAPEKTDGFDGKRAYEQVVKQVSFGPRPAGSAALGQLQNYMETELKSYGCAVETDAFSADTPAGRLAMKNILVKIPGEKPGIILLGTHYDTKRLENFVGADDGGSSTGVMLEIARVLCGQKQAGKYAVWIAFFDGEEAVNKEWVDPDNRYGSREMAARLANSEDLKKVKAFILADLVGGKQAALPAGWRVHEMAEGFGVERCAANSAMGTFSE